VTTATLTQTGAGVRGPESVPDTRTWWRPQCAPEKKVAAQAEGSRVAFIALVAFTVILLLSPQGWIPILKVIRIAFLAAGIAMAAHIVERSIHRRAVIPASTEVALALTLVFWAVVTVPFSEWPGGSVHMLLDHYLKAVAFFWLLATIITSAERLRILAWALSLCAIPLAVTGVYNYLAGEYLYTNVRGFYRISGYLGREGSGLTANPNDLALMLNLIIPISGALAFGTRGMWRAVAIGSMVVSVAAVIVTFSRAGFLTLAAMFVMLLVVLVRRRSPGLAMGLLLLALAVPPLLPSGYADRLSTITNMEEDRTGSAQGRWRDLQVAAEVVAHHPILGVGVGQDMIVLNEFRNRDTWRSVHNAYLQYAVDLGIPGLVLFVWLNLACYLTAQRVQRRASLEPGMQRLAHLAAGVQISLVAFTVAAMFHPIAYQFYFFSIGGLAVALKNTWRAEKGRAHLIPGTAQ
jgi:probable O-glycosylation ligase (exosortase A-associated)